MPTIAETLLTRRGLQTPLEVSKTMRELIGAFREPVPLGGLDGTKPILLLPLRLETRFKDDGLWIRVFPDAIAIDQHQPLLTAEEQEAGRRYVEKVAADRAAAWDALLVGRTVERAAWIARACDAATGQPGSPTVASPIARPVARALPERLAFILVSEQPDPATGKPKVRTVLGEPIPDCLPVGPDPSDPLASLSSDKQSRLLNFGGDLKWLADPETARTVGMAVRIDGLEPFERNGGFASVTALGVRLNGDAAAQVQELRSLLDAHRYGEGLSLVPQGTPTNLSSDPGAARSAAPSAGAAPPEIPGGSRFYDLETDGERLAHALGLPPEAVAGLANAEAQDGAEAVAMARALWAPTLGYFLSTMVDPALDQDTIDKVRDFFTFHVGMPLPAIRVGRQPYGILPATHFDALSFAGEGWDFETGLRNILQSARPAWDGRTDEVPRVGAGNDPDATILGILRQYPASVRFAQTRLVDAEYREATLRLRHATEQEILSERLAHALKAMSAAVNANKIVPGDPFRDTMKIFQLAERWRSGLNPLLEGAAIEEAIPLSEQNPLQPIDKLGLNYIEWLLGADPTDVIAERVAGPDGQVIAAPRALLYMLLRHGYQLEHVEGAARIRAHLDRARLTDLLREPEAVNMARTDGLVVPAYLQLLSVAATGEGDQARNVLELMAQQENRPRLDATIDVDYRRRWAEIAGRIAGGDSAAELVGTIGARQFLGALTRLKTLPTARLERLMTERLDACAYRIDAWMTGLVSQKLLGLRMGEDVRRLAAVAPAYAPERGGLYLGAYGRVEHLARRERATIEAATLPEELRGESATLFTDPATQGFVHAPSLGHAATAAILKSGERSHRRAGSVPLRVNLSSRRVRIAQWLCEGMRNGQQLGALLGYRFERALHDLKHDLEKHLPALRRAFPTYLEEQATQREGVAIEDDQPRNVVDGLRIAEAWTKKTPDGRSVLEDQLTRTGIGHDDIDVILPMAQDLADALDAVADLTLAESVHQLASGNIDRAAGVLDAAAQASHVPAQFDVVSTPLSGRSFSHRIGLLFEEPDGEEGSPWNGGAPLTPRAAADPALNRWLGRAFGDPAQVGTTVRTSNGDETVSLAALGLEPADLLMLLQDEAAGGTSELAARFAHAALAMPGREGGTISAVSFDEAGAGLRPLGEWRLMAATLRTLILGRRPLDARDFMMPRSADRPLPDGIEHDSLKERFKTLRDALEAAVKALEGAYTAGDTDKMREARWPLSLFGLSHALPPLPGQPPADVQEASGQLTRTARERLERADAQTAPREGAAGDTPPEAYVDAMRVLLGGAAAISVAFTPPDLGDQVENGGIAPVLDGPAAVDTVESWLLGLSAVRPAVGALLDVRLCSDAPDPFGARPAVWQLTSDGKPMAWCALPWDEKAPPGTLQAAVSMAMLCPDAVHRGKLWRGLLIDAWTETVPERTQTTGLAFHFDAPATEPPQVLLLAVPPGEHWSWEDLLATVEETFEAARRRMVVPTVRENDTQDPDAAFDAASMIAPLVPAILAPITARPTGLSLDFVTLATDKALTSLSQFKDLN